MWGLSAVARRTGSLLTRRALRSVDLSTLREVPRPLQFPLQRDGLDPVDQLGRARESGPIYLLASVFGLRVWMVSGVAENRAVLADSERFSTDIRKYVGKQDATGAQAIGGLGFTDPPDHTRLASTAHPRVHPTPVGPAAAADRRDRRGAAGRHRGPGASAGAPGRPRGGIRVPDPVRRDLRAARGRAGGPRLLPPARPRPLRRQPGRTRRVRCDVGVARLPDRDRPASAGRAAGRADQRLDRRARRRRSPTTSSGVWPTASSPVATRRPRA